LESLKQASDYQKLTGQGTLFAPDVVMKWVTQLYW